MPYLITALVAFGTSVILTPIVGFLAGRFGVVDRPKLPRKLHARPVPLLGGLAIFLALVIAVSVAVCMGWLPGEQIMQKYLWGLAVAGGFLVLGGSLDDRFDLKPSRQVIWPVLAAMAVVISGIGIKYVTNPFGGQLQLDAISWTVVWWEGLPYKFSLVADMFSLVWLLGMTYTTKFLDGLDGLVSGMTVIGAVVIAAVSQMIDVSQPDTAILAIAVAGAFAGFLVFNFSPAKIFLGEGGSTLAGFLLGALAIVSGGKVAIALLILGLPIFDTAAVIVRRYCRGQSVWSGDRTHLHFRLVEMGMTDRQAVLFYWFAAASLGISALLLQDWEKLVALVLVVSLSVGIVVWKSLVRNGKMS